MEMDGLSKQNDYELYYHIQLYYEIFFRQAWRIYIPFFQKPFIISH